MTGIPWRISRDTRFKRSISFCWTLNLGIATTIRTATRDRIRQTASTMIHAMLTLVWRAFRMPPIPRMGAYSTIRNSMVINSWICWISLVLRVIRDAVENRSNSVFEKEMTFRNTCSRSFRLIPAATRQERKVTHTDVSIITRAKPSILKPAPNRYLVWRASISTPWAS